MQKPTADLPATHVVFQAARRIAEGSLADALLALRRHERSGTGEPLLVFELTTGKQVELDDSSLTTALQGEKDPVPKGPGRPRLGVLSREISLLPRHWDWLEAQSLGISATLRRLVEQAMRNTPLAERQLKARTAVSRFLFAMAGNRPNYEEACRALFAGDAAAFAALIRQWPKGIRDVVQSMAQSAF